MAERSVEDRLGDVELALCSLIDLVFLDLDEGILASLTPFGVERAESLIGLRHTIGIELADRNGEGAPQMLPDQAETERVQAALAHGRDRQG